MGSVKGSHDFLRIDSENKKVIVFIDGAYHLSLF